MKRRIRRGDPQKQHYWEEVLRRWKDSGQSVRDYCRVEGLRESAFYFWRRQLEHLSRPSGAVSKPQLKASPLAAEPSPQRRSSPRRGGPSFLPLRVMAAASKCSASGGLPAQRVAGAAEATGSVEIVLPGGRMVRVESGFDRQTLADVLAVLEIRPC